MTASRFRRLFSTGRPRLLENLPDDVREERQREDDRRLQRALALAFQRGDHLPQAMKAAA